MSWCANFEFRGGAKETRSVAGGEPPGPAGSARNFQQRLQEQREQEQQEQEQFEQEEREGERREQEAVSRRLEQAHVEQQLRAQHLQWRQHGEASPPLDSAQAYAMRQRVVDSQAQQLSQAPAAKAAGGGAPVAHWALLTTPGSSSSSSSSPGMQTPARPAQAAAGAVPSSPAWPLVAADRQRHSREIELAHSGRVQAQFERELAVVKTEIAELSPQRPAVAAHGGRAGESSGYSPGGSGASPNHWQSDDGEEDEVDDVHMPGECSDEASGEDAQDLKDDGGGGTDEQHQLRLLRRLLGEDAAEDRGVAVDVEHTQGEYTEDAREGTCDNGEETDGELEVDDGHRAQYFGLAAGLFDELATSTGSYQYLSHI